MEVRLLDFIPHNCRRASHSLADHEVAKIEMHFRNKRLQINENKKQYLTIQIFSYSPLNNLRDQFEGIVTKCIIVAKEKFLAKFGRGGAIRSINGGEIIYCVVKHHMIVWRTWHRDINLGKMNSLQYVGDGKHAYLV